MKLNKFNEKMEQVITTKMFAVVYISSLVTLLITGVVTMLTYSGEATTITDAFLASFVIFFVTRRMVVVYESDESDRYYPLF